MHQQIEKVGEFVRPMVKINGPKATDGFDGVLADSPKWHEEHPIKYFVTKRRESVRRQLDGESEGHILHDPPANWPEIIGWSIAFFSVLLLNLAGWIWGIVVGFRGSTLWGCLNIFFSPLAPAIYGFAVRRDLGFRCAIFATFCLISWIVFIASAIIAISN